MKLPEMDKKIIFVINIHSIIDIITNSSSELFVFNEKEKEVVKEMITAIYPNYLDEYEEIKRIDELDVFELNQYFDYATGSWIYPAKKENYRILPGFSFDELYEPRTNHIGEIDILGGFVQYQLKRNDKYDFITDSNKEEMINKLCPDRNMYFMFSKIENPDWEMQEELSRFGDRIHLG